jgi:hypothetical protein
MHGAIPPLPQYVFMAWCLVKQRDNLLHLQLISAVLSLRLNIRIHIRANTWLLLYKVLATFAVGVCLVSCVRFIFTEK